MLKLRHLRTLKLCQSKLQMMLLNRQVLIGRNCLSELTTNFKRTSSSPLTWLTKKSLDLCFLVLMNLDLVSHMMSYLPLRKMNNLRATASNSQVSTCQPSLSVSNSETQLTFRMFLWTPSIRPWSSATNLSRWISNYPFKEFTDWVNVSMNSNLVKEPTLCGHLDRITYMMMAKVGKAYQVCIHSFSLNLPRVGSTLVCSSEMLMHRHPLLDIILITHVS